jgi:hypothetical protein
MHTHRKRVMQIDSIYIRAQVTKELNQQQRRQQQRYKRNSRDSSTTGASARADTSTTAGCGVAQTVVRRPAVRKARDRIPTCHPNGDLSSENGEDIYLERASANVINVLMNE